MKHAKFMLKLDDIQRNRTLYIERKFAGTKAAKPGKGLAQSGGRKRPEFGRIQAPKAQQRGRSKPHRQQNRPSTKK